ncbi:MAG: HNH endonuclease signature motif containing protein [Candidatus Kaiserbacteria bacterium]|nr:HNH endonuclease signature motif containing protein [Candidatus Kaiserbacteria bacterium]
MLGDEQQYELYWKITLEYSDFFGEKFRTCLAVIVAFIDEQKDIPFSSEKYEALQKRVEGVFPKADSASTRKSINQYVKLGFILPELIFYHPATKAFLHETSLGKKKALLSKIIYSDSSFDRSVTNQSDKKEINFLIKTLQKVGTLSKDGVLALMTVDVSAVPNGFLDRAGLEERRRLVDAINFGERKYNQLSYLWSLLKQLDGLVVQDDTISLQVDMAVVGDEVDDLPKKRDPYLHQIYKNQLKVESNDQFGSIACMLEKLAYPSLVASHIKPFSISSEVEAYDVNNGLLLSKNMDFLFDQGYISFLSDGSILISERLHIGVREYLKPFTLGKTFLAEARLAYLEYHRAHVFS